MTLPASPGMSPRRLAWMLRIRGADLASWPATERDAALLLLRHDEQARCLVADLLAAEEADVPDQAALSRMQRVVQRALRPATPAMRGVRWGAIAVCLAAGLYLGLPGLDQTGTNAANPLGPTVQSAYPATVLAALDE